METEERDEELKMLERIVALEDLAEKKTRIFSRLLMDAAIAKEMEGLSLRHEKRKEKLMQLLGQKPKNKQKQATVSATNGEEGDK